MGLCMESLSLLSSSLHSGLQLKQQARKAETVLPMVSLSRAWSHACSFSRNREWKPQLLLRPRPGAPTYHFCYFILDKESQEVIPVSKSGKFDSTSCVKESQRTYSYFQSITDLYNKSRPFKCQLKIQVKSIILFIGLAASIWYTLIFLHFYWYIIHIP